MRTGNQPGQHAGGCGRGFTLLETMVVVIILAILMTLVVSVGTVILDEARRQKTISILDMVKQAIHAYYRENNKAYPEVTGDTEPKPDAAVFDNTAELVTALLSLAESKKVVTRLPEGALAKDRQDSDKLKLWDGFGKAMRYERTTGLGGQPRVISSGPNGRYYTIPESGKVVDEDNIYSDRQ